MLKLTTSTINDASQKIYKIINLEGDRTFENSMSPLLELEHEVYTMSSHLGLYRYVSDNEELRGQSHAAAEKFDEFLIEI